MTTPSTPHPLPGTPDGPPPGCPAHGAGPAGPLGAGGLRRLYGPEAERDAPALFEKLRAEHGPVAPALLHDDVPVWVVLGHSENLHMLRTHSVYTRNSRRWRLIQDGTIAPDHPLTPLFAWQPICSFAEGAERERLRGAVNNAMRKIDQRGVRRAINRHSNRLVNEFGRDGRADLVSQFTDHLPMLVMLDVLGLPEEYNEEMVDAARDMLQGTETANASNAAIMGILERHVARRRAKPDDDFASSLIEDEARLTDDEVAQHLRLVLIAAYEATSNLTANVLRMVLTDPRFRAQLNGGQMTVPEAVEQTLWDQPPFSAMLGYFAVQDAELGGQRIRKGDALLLNIAAANVDPVVRPDLEAGMQGNRAHLAFGGGVYECPGDDLGRAIADTGVDALLMRLPDVELAVPETELHWTNSLISSHLKELPVVFSPRRPVALSGVPGKAAAGSDWEITSPVPGTAAAGTATPRATPPAAGPAGPAPTVPAQRGGWRRLLEWVRGD
ncbi:MULTISPECIES: cytochrome P450 [Streptomyces]|uniref:Cytochrome P450 n=1 Tax=Streptomyces gougerotii TaxID=53448 RepID=A0A8H9LSU7_9ACTN|nr:MULTISPECIES: cytochrome P450 [Streptomyces]RPK81159.1 Vitamin D(3) 25-hydroxylase [Streptomyces sp. ADI98-12]GFH76299.1 cytochrome P450 [Streptomyces gougerotii]GGU93081.1 cytochrome P450 [Streptomyces gougerotii]